MDREKMVKVTWTKPKVVVEISMNEWTDGGHLRHAEFKRIRDDKTVKQVVPYRYDIQRAPFRTGPWTTVATIVAPSSGGVEYQEVNPPPGQSFYRTLQ